MALSTQSFKAVTNKKFIWKCSCNKYEVVQDYLPKTPCPECKQSGKWYGQPQILNKGE